MHELHETVDEHIRAALRDISRNGADPSVALPVVLARGRARRARVRVAVGATGLASVVVLALLGLMLTTVEPDSTVATDPYAPATTEAPPAYAFDVTKPLVDHDLPVTPKTELAVLDGHVFSAEVTADTLTYSFTDGTGAGGAASADPKQLLALMFSGQGPGSNDPTPKNYIMGVTRVEAARIDLVRGNEVVSVPTIASDAFPGIRFFINEDANFITDDGNALAGGEARVSNVPLLIAYDSEGRALTDSHRVLAAQRESLPR